MLLVLLMKTQRPQGEERRGGEGRGCPGLGFGVSVPELGSEPTRLSSCCQAASGCSLV